MRLRVAVGESSASPACTARTARPISSGSAPLPMNPLAPARNAATRYSSSSKVVRMRTRVWASAGSPQMAAVATMPSITGIRMSISTTSGCSDLASVTAWLPSAASPTTVMPASCPSSSRSAVRMSAWSSTMSTEVIADGPIDGRLPDAAGRRVGGSAGSAGRPGRRRAAASPPFDSRPAWVRPPPCRGPRRPALGCRAGRAPRWPVRRRWSRRERQAGSSRASRAASDPTSTRTCARRSPPCLCAFVSASRRTWKATRSAATGSRVRSPSMRRVTSSPDSLKRSTSSSIRSRPGCGVASDAAGGPSAPPRGASRAGPRSRRAPRAPPT